MKNIHVFPTDKPSRLYLNGFQRLVLDDKIEIADDNSFTNQHIYITSDEEIKQEDWCIYKTGEIIHYLVKLNTDNLKKIILTTDPDLIKDGVQAIDDEFLEWFVKNPSCENVKIELIEEIPSGFTFGMFGNDEPPTELVYKIIIPKEEPFIEYTNTNDCTSMIYNPKEETLEEDLLNTAIQVVGDNNITTIKEFLVKHKWQAERMYSEEEVFNLCREFAIFVQRNGPSYKKQQEWFEQFKKK